ncbi:LTA synthase family protein [Miniphocaeibacter massiliensis]|uniref:LTA synthase family protein n=1 Tax=Miniphocaeibacter massiliensis TaxID=2041841 RepID=UPI000C1C6C99|nr:LTA synthase family protein [Miniphocaeibacter massiliensis]
MQILSYLIPGLIIGIINVLLFKYSSKFKKILSLLYISVGINIISLFVLTFIFKKESLFSSDRYNISFTLKYILATLLLGALFIALKYLIIKKTTKTAVEKLTVVTRVLIVVAIIFSIIGMVLYFGTNLLIGIFGKVAPEQFIFNLKSPMVGTATDTVAIPLEKPILGIIGFLIPFIFLLSRKYNLLSNNKKVFSYKLSRRFMYLVSLIILVGGAFYTFKELDLISVYRANFNQSNYIQDNFVDPENIKLTFPQKKRNLIHIYLESYENSYFSKELGGNMDENLMPKLEILTKEGVSFSNNDLMGGPYQTYGSSWSVASMVNMSTGLPLKVSTDRNTYGLDGYFLPGATTIGDILKKEGYEQTIMFGADADFGGLTAFFTTHGDFNIFDVKYARKKGLIPEKYNVWWGFEDNKLYDFAKEEITRLSKTGKPFNFVMENADTHFPDGYLEKEAPTPYKSQYANVIAHSQSQVYDFVRWIQKQPFYENTTIVLTGDHLSMDKNFFKDFDPDYHRTVTNVILNPILPKHEVKTQFRDFAPFDMFPTVLSSIGVEIEGDKLGLGTNLFSKEKTILEEDGFKKFEEELSKKSIFYDKKFLEK